VLNCDGPIDMDLGNDKQTKASCVKSCRIRISNHNFVSDCVVMEVSASVLTQVVVIDESLTVLKNQIIVCQKRDR
jgi:hypothetical protein